MPFDFTQVDTDPVVLALVRAKARIADRRNWCRYTLKHTLPSGRVQYCAGGAFWADDPNKSRADEFACYPALMEATEALFPGWHIMDVNNTLGHAAVMQVYDKAIDMARARALAKSMVMG